MVEVIKVVEQYRRATRDFAQAHDIPLADIDQVIREAIKESGPEQYVFPDGVHLTAKGNQLVAGEVARVLLETIRERDN